MTLTDEPLVIDLTKLDELPDTYEMAARQYLSSCIIMEMTPDWQERTGFEYQYFYNHSRIKEVFQVYLELLKL